MARAKKGGCVREGDAVTRTRPAALHGRGTSAPFATPTPWLRHLCHFGPLALFCVAALVLAWPATPLRSLPLRGLPQVVYAVVVALNVLPIGMASWSAALGALTTLWRACGGGAVGPVLRRPTGSARTAIVLPIHEEDATRVFAAAAVMADLLARERVGVVDVFVLSDTQSEVGACAERQAVERLTAMRGGAAPAIHYRRRADNAGRKAGNIAAFCAQWGGAYDFMVVLDADSTMTGAAIARLIGAMEANPNAGLIQCMCYPVDRDTLFARLQQFNAWLYGPLFQRGVAFWQGPRGNYWGHNAILRIGAFAACCGLPVLPGPAPFGGEILSHDTVEAALLLRAGWDVWMLPDGPGTWTLDSRTVESWEETPSNLLDHLGRDRRWCQGNLQHALVLATRGLRVASLYHLTRGLLHYLSSILVLAWLASTVLVDRHREPDRTLAIMVAALIVAPRLLGVIATIADGAVVRGFGGRGRLIISAVLEQVFGFLVYPVTLVFHAIFVFGTLRGHVVRWDAQARGDRGLAWREAARLLAVPLAVALALLIPVALRAPGVAALFAPGLLLGIPLAVWTSRPSAWAWQRRLFLTPEEVNPHPVRGAVVAAEHALAAAKTGVAPAPLPPARCLPFVTQVLR